MASAIIFLSLSAACFVQGSYPPMYGVWLSCLGGLNSFSSFKQGGVQSHLPHQFSSSNWLSWLVKSPQQCCIIIYLLSLFSCWQPFELTNCMPLPSHGLAAQDFLLLLILILSIYLMQGLTSIFTLSSLTLGYFGTLVLCLLFHMPMI